MKVWKRFQERLTVPERHQLKIAKSTMRMNDAMARIMGGMTKDEARLIFERLSARKAGRR